MKNKMEQVKEGTKEAFQVYQKALKNREMAWGRLQAVKKAVKKATKQARKEAEPEVLEAKTRFDIAYQETKEARDAYDLALEAFLKAQKD